jgi:hypothetical protein
MIIALIPHMAISNLANPNVVLAPSTPTSSSSSSSSNLGNKSLSNGSDAASELSKLSSFDTSQTNASTSTTRVPSKDSDFPTVSSSESSLSNSLSSTILSQIDIHPPIGPPPSRRNRFAPFIPPRTNIKTNIDRDELIKTLSDDLFKDNPRYNNDATRRAFDSRSKKYNRPEVPPSLFLSAHEKRIVRDQAQRFLNDDYVGSSVGEAWPQSKDTWSSDVEPLLFELAKQVSYKTELKQRHPYINVASGSSTRAVRRLRADKADKLVETMGSNTLSKYPIVSENTRSTQTKVDVGMGFSGDKLCSITSSNNEIELKKQIQDLTGIPIQIQELIVTTKSIQLIKQFPNEIHDLMTALVYLENDGSHHDSKYQCLEELKENVLDKLTELVSTPEEGNVVSKTNPSLHPFSAVSVLQKILKDIPDETDLNDSFSFYVSQLFSPSHDRGLTLGGIGDIDNVGDLKNSLNEIRTRMDTLEEAILSELPLE